MNSNEKDKPTSLCLELEENSDHLYNEWPVFTAENTSAPFPLKYQTRVTSLWHCKREEEDKNDQTFEAHCSTPGYCDETYDGQNKYVHVLPSTYSVDAHSSQAYAGSSSSPTEDEYVDVVSSYRTASRTAHVSAGATEITSDEEGERCQSKECGVFSKACIEAGAIAVEADEIVVLPFRRTPLTRL